MRVVILGSAAGGGVPQWNCGCSHCWSARASGLGRTQSSLAVTADGERWVLLNASPDLRQQLATRPGLWPRGARTTSVCAVVLTDAEIDHTLGLILMREAMNPLPVYAPEGVAALLGDAWPLFRVLAHYSGVKARPLTGVGTTPLRDLEGQDLGLICTAEPIAHRPPRYASGATAGAFGVGLRIEDTRTGGVLAYIPAAGAVDETVRALAAGA